MPVHTHTHTHTHAHAHTHTNTHTHTHTHLNTKKLSSYKKIPMYIHIIYKNTYMYYISIIII